PIGVYVDGSGYIWVTNNGSSNVQKYNSFGVQQGGNLTNGFTYIAGLYADASGTLWVADGNNNLLKPYSGGPWGASIGGGGSTAGLFNDIRKIYIDGGGNLWVADYLNNRIQKCTVAVGSSIAATCGTAGTPPWTTWPNSGTSSGTGPGQFNQPQGITG